MTERTMGVLKSWFELNKLTLNVAKTKYLPFVSYINGLPHLGALRVDKNTLIPEAESVKYLGVIVDRHLRWDLHVNKLAGKIRGLLGKFRYLRDFLDIAHLRTVYYALVQSQLENGIIGWGGVHDRFLKRVDVVQRWILKTMYRKRRLFSSEKLHEISAILSIRQLYCLRVLTDVHGNKIELQLTEHEYETRGKLINAEIPRCGKTVGQRSFSFLSAKLFNSLPVQLREIGNIRTCKSGVRDWLRTMGITKVNSIVNNSF